MAKEVLPVNSSTKEELPRTGTATGEFGIGRFGTAKFGTQTGYGGTKEALPNNSQTKEELSSKIT